MTGAPEFYLKGGTALTMDSVGKIIEKSVIHVKDGRIEAIGSRVKIPEGAKVVDTSGTLVMPGLVNGHTHSAMSLLRGIADDLPLRRWLEEWIFPTEKKILSPEFVYAGARLACLELIRNGVTFINDMYYHQHAVAKALDEAGLRAFCGPTVGEETGVNGDPEALLGEVEEYAETVRPYPLVTPTIAPHAIYSMSLPFWEKVVAFAGKLDLPVHLHMSETRREVDDCLESYGRTPARVFEDLGLWESRAMVAHGVHVSEEDVEILARNGVGVIYNAESNMKLSSGICPVVELRRAGIDVAFGTDGAASNNNLDLLTEADTGTKLQCLRYGAGELTSEEAVRMLTIEGARALGQGEVTGSLEKGKAADIIAVDLKGPHCHPLYEPYSHLVYSASGRDVRHNIVHGKVLMEDYQCLTLDEEAILKDAEHWGRKIRGE